MKTTFARTQTRQTTHLRQPRTGTISNFAYDAIYQLQQVTQSGQPTETYSYYDVDNRLSSLGVSPYSYDNSNELNSQPGVTYGYDANGNLISKADATGTTTYAWDVENRLTSVTLPAGGGTVTRYTQGLGIDEPLAMYRGGARELKRAGNLRNLPGRIL